MPVVSDTSPINYLVLIDAIELFPRLFGEVVIPHAVVSELLDPAAPEPVRSARPRWLRTTRTPGYPKQGLEHLDPGEVEAILLTENIGAQLLIMDDRAGVIVARERRLNNRDHWRS